jgi:hypothetical protein
MGMRPFVVTNSISTLLVAIALFFVIVGEPRLKFCCTTEMASGYATNGYQPGDLNTGQRIQRKQ